jgi:hypothetical protein
MTSSDSTPVLDLERDLPTTDEDVRALRRLRPKAHLRDLQDLRRLESPSWMRKLAGRRPVFRDGPPFQL